jgi:hypothetical protein
MLSDACGASAAGPVKSSGRLFGFMTTRRTHAPASAAVNLAVSGGVGKRDRTDQQGCGWAFRAATGVTTSTFA